MVDVMIMASSLSTRRPDTATATCSFCSIAQHRAQADIVQEWPDAVALRPRSGGVHPGHLLVIPRVHVQDAAADPVVTATVMARAAELMAKHPDANLITSRGAYASQTQLHLHVHLVPRERDDGLPLPWTPQHAARAAQEANRG